MAIRLYAFMIAAIAGTVILTVLSTRQIAPEDALPSPLIDVFAVFGLFSPENRQNDMIHVLWCLPPLVVFPGIGALYAFLHRRKQATSVKKVDILLGSSLSGMLAALAYSLVELVIMAVILLQDYRETITLGFSQEDLTIIYGLFIGAVIINSVMGMAVALMLSGLLAGAGGLVVAILRR